LVVVLFLPGVNLPSSLFGSNLGYRLLFLWAQGQRGHAPISPLTHNNWQRTPAVMFSSWFTLSRKPWRSWSPSRSWSTR
jgi:hypothetical protein